MFTCEDEQERKEYGVEDALPNVTQEEHVGHVKEEGEPLNWKVEEFDRESYAHDHIFQQNGGSTLCLYSIPVPDDHNHHQRRENCLQRKPNFGESPVLMNRNHINVIQASNFLHEINPFTTISKSWDN